MADAEVRVVARAMGFEDVASRARAATDALRRMGEATAKAGSTNSGPFGQMARQIDDATRRMQQFRREQDRMWNGRDIGVRMGESFRRSMEQAMARPLVIPTGFFANLGHGVRREVSEAFRLVGREVANHPTHAMFAGMALRHAGSGMVSSLDLFREQQRMGMAGVDQAGVDEATQKAASTSAKYRNLSQTDLMHMINDLRGVVGSQHKAVEDLDLIAQPAAFLKAYDGGKHDGAVSDILAEMNAAMKSGEIAGFQNPADLRRHVLNLTAMKIAFGEQVKIRDYLTAQRAASVSGLEWSDRFRYGIFAAQVQERGSNAGVMLATAWQKIVANIRLAKVSKSELANYGLLDKKGDIVGGNLYQTDPDKFANEVVLPAILKKNPHATRADLGRIIGKMFQDRNAAMAIIDLLIMDKKYQKDAELVAKAQKVVGPDGKGMDDYVGRSFDAKMQAFASQWKTLKDNIGLIMQGPMSWIVGSSANIMSMLADFSKSNPIATVIGGTAAASGAGLLGLILGRRFGWARALLGMGAGAMFGGDMVSMLFGSMLAERIAGGFGGAAAGAARGGVLRRVFGGLRNVIGGLLGFNTNMGDIMAKGRISGVAARLSRLAAAIPGLSRVIGLLGKIGSSILGLPGLAAGAGYAWVNKTESGSAWWQYVKDYWEYSKHKYQGADRKTLDADIARLRKSNRTANNKFYGLIDDAKSFLGIGEDSHATKLKRIGQWRNQYAWMHQYRTQEIPLPVRRPKLDANGNPTSDYLGVGAGLGWAMPKIGRKQIRQDLREGRAAGASGPVPVTIVGQKEQPKQPPVINVTNNITVNASGLGAIGGAIAGAVGPATASSVSNALSDTHH